MLLLRQTSLLARIPARLYASKPLKEMPTHLHMEVLRHVSPSVCVYVHAEILVKIRPANLRKFPAADTLVAELHGGPVRSGTAELSVHIGNSEERVDVDLRKKMAHNECHCELFVPPKASVRVVGDGPVIISQMHGDTVSVDTTNDINLKDIRSNKIELRTAGGHVRCAGVLQAASTTIETSDVGTISVEKLLGDKASCKTDKGNISTNSCYVEDSSFETNTGALNLKNVHKKTAVFVHKKGDLKMSGLNGNFNILSNGGKVDLQLSEIRGHNFVTVNNVPEAVINISDAIEEQSFIDINASKIVLGGTLSHLHDCINKEGKHFVMSTERENVDKLVVSTKGVVNLGKLSWADNIRASLGKGGQ